MADRVWGIYNAGNCCGFCAIANAEGWTWNNPPHLHDNCECEFFRLDDTGGKYLGQYKAQRLVDLAKNMAKELQPYTHGEQLEKVIVTYLDVIRQLNLSPNQQIDKVKFFDVLEKQKGKTVQAIVKSILQAGINTILK